MSKKLETIPTTVKKLFFKTKQAPNLLTDYDVVGFDADHCLVKYNVHSLQRMVNEVTVKDLHEDSGWPKEILDLPEDALKYAMNCTTFDIQKGNFLKICTDKQISMGYHGFTKLSAKELES